MLNPQQAFREKILEGNSIVNALFKDPMLPDEFLPVNWKANELRQDFSHYMKTLNSQSKPFVEKIFAN